MERVIELNLEETIWTKMSAIYQYYSPSLRGPYLTDEKEEQPMMSLAIVAELAHKSSTNGQDFDEEILNKVVRAIASCVDVFECPVRKSDGPPKLLTPEEMQQGHFRGGGLTLNIKGRPDRINLCIRATDLSRAIVEINHAFKPRGLNRLGRHIDEERAKWNERELYAGLTITVSTIAPSSRRGSMDARARTRVPHSATPRHCPSMWYKAPNGHNSS